MKTNYLIVNVVSYSFKKHCLHLRTLVILAFLLLYIIYSVHEYKCCAYDYNARIPALQLFIYFMCDPRKSIGVYVCWILFICNTPIVNSNNYAIRIRVNSIYSVIGQQIYYLISTILYLSIVVLFIGVAILNIIDLTIEWGTFFKSCWYAELLNLVEGRIQLDYTVIEAFLLLFILNVILLNIMWQIMYTINFTFNTTAGILIALMLVLVHYTIWCNGPFWILWISPVSLVDLVHLDIHGRLKVPSLNYAFKYLLLLSTALFGVNILIQFKHRSNLIYTYEGGNHHGSH